MRSNQNLIRSTLCDNPALQKLVTLYPVGLGVAPANCYVYSGDGNLGTHWGMMRGRPNVHSQAANLRTLGLPGQCPSTARHAASLREGLALGSDSHPPHRGWCAKPIVMTHIISVAASLRH